MDRNRRKRISSGSRGSGRNSSTRISRNTNTRTTANRRSSSGQRRSSGSFTFNIALLIASIIAGVFSWIIGNIIYETFFNRIPQAFVIGAVFAILCIIILIVVYIFSHVSGAADDLVFPLPDIPGIIPIVMIVGMVAVFFLGSLFQWIYAMDFQKQEQTPTSYIFVIDDSGSTAQSDPEQMRYSAIDDVLDGMDENFPYMIYSFSDDYKIVRDMAPISEGKADLTGNSYGGTAIRGILNQVIDDYKNNVWNGGDRPRVILMTDGYATDIGFFRPIKKVLKQYVREGISISTVGLTQVDEKLMEQIADTTGGVFISASDAEELSSAMQSAVTQTSDRDLVSVRPITKSNILLGFLRILFIFILGMVIGLLSFLVYGSDESAGIIIISTAVKSIIGALIMELGTGIFGTPSKFAWFILWILLAATLALKPDRRETRVRNMGSDMIRN